MRSQHGERKVMALRPVGEWLPSALGIRSERIVGHVLEDIHALQVHAAAAHPDPHGSGVVEICYAVVSRGWRTPCMGAPELEELCVQDGVGLAEGLVLLLGFGKQCLEILYPLVFSLAVGALGCSVLGSAPLHGADMSVTFASYQGKRHCRDERVAGEE
jgi:hypothetical protein